MIVLWTSLAVGFAWLIAAGIVLSNPNRSYRAKKNVRFAAIFVIGFLVVGQVVYAVETGAAA